MDYKELVKSIKEHEGYRSRIYKDSLGYDTIGYGFAIKNLYISRANADLILKDKLNVLITTASEDMPWVLHMPDIIQNVIFEMCYQMGIGGFHTFPKAISYMQTRQWEKAADEMLDSKWHKQTPKRAEEMAEIVRQCNVL